MHPRPKPNGQNFSEELGEEVHQTDGPEILGVGGVRGFRQQDYVSRVQKVQGARGSALKGPDCPHDVNLDKLPALLEE
jgi:hypothetical protein